MEEVFILVAAALLFTGVAAFGSALVLVVWTLAQRIPDVERDERRSLWP